MKELSFRGSVENGKLQFKSAAYFNYRIREYEGKKVIFKVIPLRARRSLEANAYYWGVVLPAISEHTGHTPEELHEIYKKKYVPTRIVTYREKNIELEKSTTELSVQEFSDYLERVMVEAAELGITVQSPEEHYQDSREKTKEKIRKAFEEFPVFPASDVADDDIDPTATPF